MKNLLGGRSNERPFFMSRPLEKVLSSLVPIRAEWYSLNKDARLKLQQGHDAFHQQRYEDAIQNYLDIAEAWPDTPDVWLALAISFYFIGAYRKSHVAADYYSTLGTYLSEKIDPVYVLLQKTLTY